MNYSELKQHLARAKVAPPFSAEGLQAMYVLWGDDAYLKSSAASFFRSTLLDGEFADMNFERLSYQDGLSAVLDSLMQLPLFGGIRVVELSDVPDKMNDDDKFALDRYLMDPNPTAVLVEICGDTVTKSALSGAVYVNCSKLDINALDVEIKRILSLSPSRTIDRDAEHELCSRTASDLTRIVAELNKLKAYSSGNITKSDVELLVSADLDYQIYEIAEAVSSKNGDKTLSVLNNLLSGDTHPMTILSNLYSHYRKLLHVSLHPDDADADVAKWLGMNVKALYYIRRGAKNYTQLKLKRSVDYLHSLQCKVLSGELNESQALDEAVLTLLAT